MTESETKRRGRRAQGVSVVQILLTPAQIAWLDQRARQEADSRSSCLRRILNRALNEDTQEAER
jgi:hypothetical protein